MSFKITVQPTVEPITLAEAKMHLRIDGDFEDTILLDYIRAARAHVERFTGLSFTEQTIRAVFDIPREHEIDRSAKKNPLKFVLPLSPVKTLLSVEGNNNDDVDDWGDYYYIADSAYKMDYASLPSTITLRSYEPQLIVTYETDTSAMSPDVKVAMLLILHQMYENRGMVDGVHIERIEESYLRAHRVLFGMA
jgi:uncharacterized phiE125 gp8 family phage protein